MRQKVWGLIPLNLPAAPETHPKAERFAQNFHGGSRPAGCSFPDITPSPANAQSDPTTKRLVTPLATMKLMLSRWRPAHAHSTT